MEQCLFDWTLLAEGMMEAETERRERCGFTGSIVRRGPYWRDGWSTRRRIRSLPVSLYRGGGANKMILRIAVLRKEKDERVGIRFRLLVIVSAMLTSMSVNMNY